MIIEKEVIIDILDKNKETEEFISVALKLGFRSFICDNLPDGLKEKPGVTVYSPTSQGDVLIISEKEVDTLKDVEGLGRFAACIEVKRKEDEMKAIEASRRGATAVFVKTKDWKIIPLENLIAKLHKSKTKLLARIKDITEVETMFNILELGVDGIIFSPKETEDIDKLAKALTTLQRKDLILARVVEKRDAGVGDRVCVDTASILKPDEGMLIGSQSKLFFFILGETSESKFVAPRPFRVNAGPVHNYILLPNGKTKYLSELEGGDEVLLIDVKGVPRKAIVGRVKIERRPLSLVKVEYGDNTGCILVQNAETIRFINAKGEGVPVTEIKLGDEILVHISGKGGRHFGVEVEEFVIER